MDSLYDSSLSHAVEETFEAGSYETKEPTLWTTREQLMRQRAPEQIMALEAESLSDWQLIRMSLVCGRINAVRPPDGAGRIQRLLIWFQNLGSKDASVFEKAFFVFITCVITICSLVCLGIFISILETAGAPWWSRYFPTSILIIVILALVYASKIAILRAGGDVLVVEGYKRRIAEKAAERRKHYRPISARELDGKRS